MIGLLAALILAGLNFANNDSIAQVYAKSVNFLLWWYLVTTVIYVMYLVVHTPVAYMVSLSTLRQLAPIKNGPSQNIFTYIDMTIVRLIKPVFGRMMQIVGVILLSKAMINTNPTWDNSKLILGLLFVLVGILIANNKKYLNSLFD